MRAHWHMIRWETRAELILSLSTFLFLVLTSYFLPVGVSVGHYSFNWMPLCKHTHSCLSGPSIWHKEEAQGHHSHLSVWLYSDIRHPEAAPLDCEDILYASSHKVVPVLAVRTTWKGYSFCLLSRHPDKSRSSPLTKSLSNKVWLARELSHSVHCWPELSHSSALLLKTPDCTLKGKQSCVPDFLRLRLPNLILCYSLFFHLFWRCMVILKVGSPSYKLKRHPPNKRLCTAESWYTNTGTV